MFSPINNVKQNVIFQYPVYTHSLITDREYESKLELKRTLPIQLVIEGINNDVQKKYIRKKFGLISTNKLDYKNLKQTLGIMSQSGLFSEIQVQYEYYKKYQLIRLNLTLNPVLNKIYIYNSEKIQIPKKVLKEIFEEQIGYPKNLTKINNSLNKIIHWYKDRGFNWISIQICQSKSSPQEICLKINEGVIDQIILNYHPKFTDLSSNLFVQKSLILDYLDLHTGKFLNKFDLERSLKKLKKYKIIDNGYYEISKAHQNKYNINLILDIYLFPTNANYIMLKCDLFSSVVVNSYI